MYKKSFGKYQQIQFANENEFYRLLGYLAKSNGSSSLALEHNEKQGAWAQEKRIHIHKHNFTNNICKKLSLTAGNGSNIAYRINCNDFVENICNDHGFVYGYHQNINEIFKTIPDQFIQDFQEGLNL